MSNTEESNCATGDKVLKMHQTETLMKVGRDHSAFALQISILPGHL